MNIYIKNLPIGYDLRKYQLYTMGGALHLLFPMCFHQVPKGVPQNVPNNTSNLSHIVWPQFNFHVYKTFRKEIIFIFLFKGGSGESAQCSKKIGDGPINVAPSAY
jgi:hypothetical protein